MYERNAIILERYFDEMFGYNLKSNIKTNFKNYCELVEIQEKYKNITEEEEEIIIEYDLIANKIGDIQKNQQSLNEENLKYQQQREQIFDNIDEDAGAIQKDLDIINQNIQDIDIQIKENASKFINAVAEFSEKSLVRSKCGKNRKDIEFDYNNLLNETLDNYRSIDTRFEQKAKQFSEKDTFELEKELEKIIEENGKKEKIQFNKDAIKQAINLSIEIQKREADILTYTYEKTSKLFAEIKSGKLKIDTHKKIIIDSKSKQDFLSAVKEYLVQFLDNERLVSVNGENEYNQLMKDACKNLKDDLVQINNLYTLLIKEITKKATKKIYNELYKIEYLDGLKKKSEEFEAQVKKLKLPVTIINPNYWRIEGMQKIYDVFDRCVTENYGRDLSEFIPLNNVDNEDDDEDEKVDLDVDNKNIEKNQNETKQQNVEKIESKKQTENDKNDAQDDENRKLNSVKSEIDRKIDLILGLNKNDEQSNLEEFEDTEAYDDNYNELDDFSEDEEKEIPNNNEEYDDENSNEYVFDEDEEYEEFNEDEDMTNEEIQSDDDYNEEDDEKWDEEKEEYEEDDAEDYDDDDENKKQVWEEKDDVDFIWNVNDENEQNIQTTEDIENEEDDVEDNVQDNSSEDANYDIWGNNISKKNNKKGKHRKDNKENSNWEDEFVNIDSTPKKKKGFFNKFKK